LWRIDSASPGIRLLSGVPIVPQSLRAYGSQLFFVASGSDGGELWHSDGTPQGTAFVKTVNPWFEDPKSIALALIDGILLFSGDDGVHGRELWRSDGTRDGTYMLQDICPGACESNPTGFTKSGSWVFFSANDGVSGDELWEMPVSALSDNRAVISKARRAGRPAPGAPG